MRKKYRKLFIVLISSFLAFLVSLPIYSETVIIQPDTVVINDRWNPWWTDHGMWGPGMITPGQRQRMTRHWSFMNTGLPKEYYGATNPLLPTSEVKEQGNLLYRQNCLKCHGAQGMGDGDIAHSLNPSPALLAHLIQMPMTVDGYLLWSISEGGDQFGTGMPAFKDKLPREVIWKIITFMRAGFPSETESN